jgi:hypothetical protein
MTPRMPEPRTKAGRALLAARPIETETTSGRTLRSPDKVLRKAILAIEAEASRIDVERLARAFVAVGLIIDGMSAAEARQMVEHLAAEYQKLT